MAFYRNKIKEAYILFGGAWNTKGPGGFKLPIYGILQRNGSIRLPLVYFGEFGDRLKQNPLTTFEEFYVHITSHMRITGSYKSLKPSHIRN